MKATLLLEVGCEEIPARMIRSAATDLGARVEALLDGAGLARGAALAWGGSRRLSVRVADVQERQADRDEQVLGPPVSAAFAADGSLTGAGAGFARKQGIEPARLERVQTEKGSYAGFVRRVAGRSVGEVLAAGLPAAVAGMSFPKTMRWADGTHRWVRPVHALVALHGATVLAIELFGVRSGNRSAGHRFLSTGAVAIPDADHYADTLRAAHVIADPDERRARIADGLLRAARDEGGEPIADPALLEETVDLVEWPGVVTGRFDAAFLELPREILVTTLRHHQKCFCVERGGTLLPAFVAVANTDSDRSGHVRRGNEWVVGGRLQDARFFYEEDGSKPLAERRDKLGSVVFHARVGTYADKSLRLARVARAVAGAIQASAGNSAAAAVAGELAKVDLTTGLVGEFPELQGIVGGLLLRNEGANEDVWRAVYEQYRPAGSDDSIPSSETGAIVSIADKLDSIARLLAAGEAPSGSRDPYGLRRAANGVFRIVAERQWPLSLHALAGLAEGGPETTEFLSDRFRLHLRESGFMPNEVQAVLKPSVNGSEYMGWHLHDILARLAAIRPLRGREDFDHLVELTKRVDNILTKNAAALQAASAASSRPDTPWSETEPAARALEALVAELAPRMESSVKERNYRAAVEFISQFIDPVERFFSEVLVLDPKQPAATLHRARLLREGLKPLLTSTFDIRELAGQADKGA